LNSSVFNASGLERKHHESLIQMVGQEFMNAVGKETLDARLKLIELASQANE
jgi:hypothetical protein